MKAEELRIGNWVKDKRNGFCKVHDVLQDGIDLYYDWCAITHDEIEPIPITEEILNKIEFPKSNLDIFLMEKIIGYEGDGVCIWIVDDEFKALEIKQGILYLHQLQNIVHALTGEELKIEL